MTNTCKIDGQIEEVRRLISKSTSETSSLETRLRELENQRSILVNPNANLALEIIRVFTGYYKNPSAEADGSDVKLSYEVDKGDDYLAGGLASALHDGGFWVKYVRPNELSDRITVLLIKN